MRVWSRQLYRVAYWYRYAEGARSYPGLPCVGVSTLQAVAHAAGTSPVTVALLPAGRGELFSQMFSVSADGRVTELDTAAHISPAKVIERYGHLDDVIWAGPGAHAQKDFLIHHAAEHDIAFHEEASQGTGQFAGWKLAPEIDSLARHVAALALESFRQGNTQSPESLSAVYVRPSDAELKGLCL